MKKSKIYNCLLWIIGFVFGKLFNSLLKNVHINKFLKWIIGVIIIIIIFFIISKVTNLLKREKNSL
ncbi:hypothetical protein NRP93_001841 [Clostridium botulinum]|nr:hypothetical protein [Clostridium botulinum]